MRITDLPSPGVLSHGQQLRRLVASAISYHETQKMLRGGHPASDAKTLMDFFFAAHEAMVAVSADDGKDAGKSSKQ